MLPSQLLEHVETVTARPQMVALSLARPQVRQTQGRTKAELDFSKKKPVPGQAAKTFSGSWPSHGNSMTMI